MRSLMKKMHKGEKGLTLIELLIVVAIIGIIAAVVIPNLGAFMVTGRISAANTELENVKTASLAYYAEYEAWPVDTSDPNFQLLIAGTVNGTYTFCDEYGWVIGVTDHSFNGLAFSPGAPDIGGNHGTWVRAGAPAPDPDPDPDPDP